MMSLPQEVEEKFRCLQKRIRGYGRIAIAFSGGVDSSLLLKIAHDTFGDNTIALFADSVVQTEAERLNAYAVAEMIGAKILRVDFSPMAITEFVNNSSMRCYYCKKNVFSIFSELARQQSFPLLADGTNFDDLSADRPGMQAVIELGVKSPLAEEGLTKSDIRILSRALGLPTWNKPSASCLATRIAIDTPITRERLALVEQAEQILHESDYRGCRARLNGDGFIIELAEGDVPRFTLSGDWLRVRKRLNALGAKKVFLDLLERESILT